MVLNVRRKSYKKRALTSLNWHLGPDFGQGLYVFGFRAPAASSEDHMRLLQDMVLNVRRKSYKKRALTSLNWHWGPTFHVAVKLYALLQKAALSKPLLVHIETNEPLTVLGALICNDTGMCTRPHLHNDSRQAPDGSRRAHLQ